MRYMGGKTKIAKTLTYIINTYLQPDQVYYEPFIGGCNVLPLVSASKRVGADVNESIILFYNALNSGWIPPTTCTKDEYLALKVSTESALKGFIGMSCGFGGVYFGTYAQDSTGRNYCLNGHNTAIKLQQQLRPSDEFIYGSYDSLVYNPNSLIYCDPPYQNTSGYKSGKFDHSKFFEWTKHMGSLGHTVLLTEYNAPDIFTPIYTWRRTQALHVKKPGQETLYILKESNNE